MNASIKKEDFLAIAGGAVLVLIGGGLAFLGLGALGQKEEEVQTLLERLGNPGLAALLADPEGVVRAGRESAELQKLDKELRERAESTLGQWAKGAQEAAGEGQEWSKEPGKWKDQLIQIQSRLLKEASASRVQLGPNFYLGLEAYRQKSPLAGEVPGLAIHLSVAAHLVDRLIEARKVGEQYPTLCEVKSLSGPGTVPDQAPAAAPPGQPSKPSPGPTELDRKRFRLEIRCSPEVLYEYVRLLTQDSWLIILTDMSVTNDQQIFPLRSEIAKKFATPELPAGEAAGEKRGRRLLEILAGKESITANMELDFVAWKNPEGAKVALPATPSP